MKKLAIALLAISLTGCGALLNYEAKSAKEAAQLIKKYCDSSNKFVRDRIKANVNAELDAINANAHIDKSVCNE